MVGKLVGLPCDFVWANAGNFITGFVVGDQIKDGGGYSKFYPGKVKRHT